MGNPEIYYKKILYKTLHTISWEDEFSSDEELLKIKNTSFSNCDMPTGELEDILLSYNEKMSTERFYYLCGQSSCAIFKDAMSEGGDQANACCASCGAFEDLLGIGEE